MNATVIFPFDASGSLRVALAVNITDSPGVADLGVMSRVSAVRVGGSFGFSGTLTGSGTAAWRDGDADDFPFLENRDPIPRNNAGIPLKIIASTSGAIASPSALPSSAFAFEPEL